MLEIPSTERETARLRCSIFLAMCVSFSSELAHRDHRYRSYLWGVAIHLERYLELEGQ